MPGCRFSQHYMDKQRDRWIVVSGFPLPDFLELNAATMADLLSEALARWGPGAPLSEQKWPVFH
jgi:hypothetical protein